MTPSKPARRGGATPPAFPCAVCGGPVTRRQGRPKRITCPRCRFRIYDYPRLCVGFVVRRGADTLVLTRGDEPRRGFLDLPGGFLEAGEDLEGGARRELLEETGLRVGRARLLGHYWDRYQLSGFGSFPTLSFYFVAAWRSGTPRAADDAAAAHWMSPTALGNPATRRRFAWPSVGEAIGDARRLVS